jgi:CMP-N,N'-diacetyllegionaminic acid synthase
MVVALVPARSGSKGVPGKNVADLAGFPLIAYSVRAGVLASEIDRVIVTTDARDIADVAVAHGAEAPFLRPEELAGDRAIDIDYIRHALGWLAEHEGAEPEMVVQLRPTTPLRDPGRLDEAIRALREHGDATGLRSVHELPEPPQKMLGIDDGWLTGLFPHETRPDYFNLPRQAFPAAYWPNGYVDVVLPETIAHGDALYGDRVLAFTTEPVTEVDGPEDLRYLRFTVSESEHPLLARLRESMPDGSR